MNFYNLHSIVAAEKRAIPVREQTESFGVARERREPYIEPTFDKSVFEQERPAVVLISAFGATGKTALAQVLSHRTGLPLLDLGRHKPVGDNTLTGLLTNAFWVQDLSRVFEGIGQGTFGVIIDGIDEGRSKTNQKAFEAFLDDIARLCKGSPTTSFVLLGRTQVLEDCWVYLTDKGTSAGLMTISPFDLDGARRYVDEFTEGLSSAHAGEYRQARDAILDALGAAFTYGAPEVDRNFLSFIGYPPVLDAIVTLLRQERDYHRLSGELSGRDGDDVEIRLLSRIAGYILKREKNEKVLPNIVHPLIAEMPQKEIGRVCDEIFGDLEQCMRLVSHCLGESLNLRAIGEPVIDEKYEAQLEPFLPEHPFIVGRHFRNAVFEAVALSTLILSHRSEAIQLVLEYMDCHKYNYHLVYLLHHLAEGRRISISVLRVLLGSALEFQSRTASVEIGVLGPDVNDVEAGRGGAGLVEIQIGIIMGFDGERSREFVFHSDLGDTDLVRLCDRLSSTYVSLPCDVLMSSTQDLEFTAPVMISAAKVTLHAPALVLKLSAAPADTFVVLEAVSVESTVGSIVTNGVEFVIAVTDRTGLAYPMIRHVEARTASMPDPLLREKYLRLRRILVHFRSHSKGGLAKYRDKVEHERVAGNELGRAILQRLVEDQVLTLSGSFYFVQPDNLRDRLGVSYQDLSMGRTSPKVEQYLRLV